jgi:hypothetical protein
MASDADAGARLLAHKLANALIEEVRIARPLDIALKIGTLGVSGLMFDQFHNIYGGLWVGGAVDLFEDRLVFAPNALNKAIQTGALALDVPLASITKVSWRFGVVTGIVDLDCGDHRLSIRCYGSKAFAAMVEAAVAAARA